MIKKDVNADLRQLNDILILAGEFDGSVFGGFVRDVIIPKSVNSEVAVTWKDVDLWFKNKPSTIEFVQRLSKMYQLECSHTKHISESVTDYILSLSEETDDTYPFARCQINVISPISKKQLFVIDLIISDMLIVDDFYVNTLAYTFTGGERTTMFSEVCTNVCPEYTEKELIEQITEKRIVMMPSYITRLETVHDRNSSRDERRRIISARIYHRYMRRGWVIVDNDNTLIFNKELKRNVGRSNLCTTIVKESYRRYQQVIKMRKAFKEAQKDEVRSILPVNRVPFCPAAMTRVNCTRTETNEPCEDESIGSKRAKDETIVREIIVNENKPINTDFSASNALMIIDQLRMTISLAQKQLDLLEASLSAL
jgi:hypothetical protein